MFEILVYLPYYQVHRYELLNTISLLQTLFLNIILYGDPSLSENSKFRKQDFIWPCAHVIYEQAHEDLVLITLMGCEISEEPALMYNLLRAFAAHTHKDRM